MLSFNPLLSENRIVGREERAEGRRGGSVGLREGGDGVQEGDVVVCEVWWDFVLMVVVGVLRHSRGEAFRRTRLKLIRVIGRGGGASVCIQRSKLWKAMRARCGVCEIERRKVCGLEVRASARFTRC